MKRYLVLAGNISENQGWDGLLKSDHDDLEDAKAHAQAWIKYGQKCDFTFMKGRSQDWAEVVDTHADKTYQVIVRYGTPVIKAVRLDDWNVAEEPPPICGP